jgi:NAD(P)-dependent dehydrogenase (short-subunit alcohol dehydrogenase family)
MAGRRCALILGAGEGIGAALARKLSAQGYLVAAASRSATKKAGSFPPGVKLFDCDAAVDADVAALVDRVEAEVAPIELAIYNAGACVKVYAGECVGAA